MCYCYTRRLVQVKTLTVSAHFQITLYESVMANLEQCVTTYMLLKGMKGKSLFSFLILIRHLEFIAFSFRLENLNIKLLLDFPEKQEGECSLAKKQLTDFSSGCGPLFILL